MAVHLGARSPDLERRLHDAPRQAAKAAEGGLERAGDALGSVVGKLQDSIDGEDWERELRSAGARLRTEAEHVADEIDPRSRNQAAAIALVLVLSLVAIGATLVLRQRATAKRAAARAKRAKAAAKRRATKPSSKGA
jgi:hypothetical protein